MSGALRARRARRDATTSPRHADRSPNLATKGTKSTKEIYLNFPAAGNLLCFLCLLWLIFLCYCVARFPHSSQFPKGQAYGTHG